jgi:hypothetical protein
MMRTLRLASLPMLFAGMACAAAPSVPTLDADALRPGQKAEVRTVFAGDRIESFDAEILGVLKGGRVEGDVILARATSDRVSKTGIAQGMSGSPVYVDGKLVGALSSGWSFSREPIFGITPIQEMLRVLDLPPALEADRSSSGPTGSEPGEAAGFREFRWPGDPSSSATPSGGAPAPGNPAGLTASYGSLAALPIPLACSGLQPAAMEPARRLFEPLGLSVVPGGQASSPPGPSELVPGAAVAVDVMRGDLQMSAIGTVTYRDRDRVLIFGHPFFQSGAVRMPLATAEIVTIVPNSVSSFKLGMRGREVGVATQDRRVAVGGSIGGHASMLPVAVTVRAQGRDAQTFHFEALEDRSLAPSLIPVAAMNSVLESGGTGAGQTVRWRLRLAAHGRPPLDIHDVSAGETALNDLVTGVGLPLRYLFNNPYRRLALDSISVAIEVRPERDQWTLRAARLENIAVRPGGIARVRCELERWRGGRDIRTIELPIPEEMPPGRYTVWVGGGGELTRFEAQRSPAHFRPTSLEDAWRRLGASRSDDALYASLIARAPEVTTEGRDYPELPSSALVLLAGGASTADRRRSDTAWMGESRVPFDGAVQGELQLELMVDDRAP